MLRLSGKIAFSLALMLALLIPPPPAWGQIRTLPRQGPDRIIILKEVERVILRYTNEARRKNGLCPLAVDQALVDTARAHTEDMLRRHFFSHVNPDGKSSGDRIGMVYAGTASRAGENIWAGSGQNSADSRLLARVIVDSWLTSPGHRANILNPDYTHIGIAVGAMGKELRATQNFVQIRRRP